MATESNLTTFFMALLDFEGVKWTETLFVFNYLYSKTPKKVYKKYTKITATKVPTFVEFLVRRNTCFLTVR